MIPAEPVVKEVARGAVRILSENWTAFVKSIGSGISVSSATVSSEPTGISFGAVTTSSDVTTVTATVPASQSLGCHQIKWTATLSNGEKEVRSTSLNVVEHKR